MTASVINTAGILTLYLSKINGLLKRPVDLRNLITSLITPLFKLLELLVEPYSKYATFSLAFNLEKMYQICKVCRRVQLKTSDLWIKKQWQHI